MPPPNRPVDNVPRPKSVTYIDHDDPFVLADHACGDPHVNALSRNAWVCCGENIYVLDCLGKVYIRIAPAPPDESSDGTPHAPASPPVQRSLAVPL